MTSTIIIAGSPSLESRTLRLAREAQRRLELLACSTALLELRTLPAEDLMHGRSAAPAIAQALEEVAQASSVVLVTPIYKAAYSGLAKAFMDLLPQYGLRGKVVLPLASGGSAAHVLAIDYALRPMLQSMDPAQITAGLFVLDAQLGLNEQGHLELDAELSQRLDSALTAFVTALRSRTGLSPR